MTYSLKKTSFFNTFHSILHNLCPICSAHLNFDNQEDSVYISCLTNLEHFELSGFKDLGTGNLVLVYINGSNEGIVDEKIIQEFQNVIYRKLYSL